MSEHYIEFQDVSIGFGALVVLDGVNFHVDRGETAVIMGRSGVGKSVSLKIIMGFLEADEGRVIVAGQDVTTPTEEQSREIHEKVTMVFQSGALFDSLTVAENVAFPLEKSAKLDEKQKEARVKELLEMLEVTQYADSLPADLSTGTKRAVAIARALAHDPEAILYDEPTTMVDPLMASHMADLVLRLKEKFHKTSIVVTHDTHLAKLIADKLIFLQKGKVLFSGTWKEFEESSEPFLELFRKEDELIPALDMRE
jgi:phospholipid/cholesterol/gamma-HCH transport system ATP-binding protein